MKRNRKEIEESKNKILELLSKGYSRKDIAAYLKLPSRTFDRYWSEVLDEQDELLKKERKELLVGFCRRSLNRIREASHRYNESKEKAWLYAAHNFEKDFFDKMQSIGLIPKEAEKIDLSVTERILNDLKRARELKRH